MIRSLYQSALDYSRKINGSILFMLVFVLDVKMLVKMIALLVLLVIHHKLLRNKNVFQQRFTWFYWGMIAIALFNLLLTITSFSLNYTISVLAGIGLWMMSIAAAFLNYWLVADTDKEKLDRTINLFFMLNAIVSIGQLLYIVWESGAANPYLYQGEYQKYFINTGDRIRGITFDLSATNSFISAFGVIYYLYSEKIGKTLLCMFVLLLTISNYTNILLVTVLALIFIFHSNKVKKSIILVCMTLLVVFMTKVSPQNINYIEDSFLRMMTGKTRIVKPVILDNRTLADMPDSTLSPDMKKKKLAFIYVDSIGRIQLLKNENGEMATATVEKLLIPKPNIHSPPFWRKRDTTELQREMLAFISQKLDDPDSTEKIVGGRRLPGKLISFIQIVKYFKAHPAKIFMGTGAGNFSSKLAFRTTGMRIMGGYPSRFTRINDAFLHNHFQLYLEYYSKDIELHSLMHNPNSVYAQIIAEYGLVGLVCFTLFYVLFFVRKGGKSGYGLPLLFLLLGAFATDYWFEHLSIAILFELLMLTLIKNKNAGS